MLHIGLVALSLLAAPAGVRFGDDEAIRIIQLNAQAAVEMDSGDFNAARKNLVEAERLAKRRGKAGDALLARTWLHMGALVAVAGAPRDKAVEYFRSALSRQPDIRPTGKIARRGEVRRCFATAEEELSPPPPTDRRWSDWMGFYCPFPDRFPFEGAVVLRCAARAPLPVASVTLFYRKRAGSEPYTAIQMPRNEHGWWTAVVGIAQIDGDSLQFYFEGRDGRERPVVLNAQADSPHVVPLVSRRECICR